MLGKCKARVTELGRGMYGLTRQCKRKSRYYGYCFQHRKSYISLKARKRMAERSQWKDPVTAPHNEPVLVTVYDAIGDDCTVTVAEFGANSWHEITVEGYNKIEHDYKVIGWQHLPEVMEIEDESMG